MRPDAGVVALAAGGAIAWAALVVAPLVAVYAGGGAEAASTGAVGVQPAVVVRTFLLAAVVAAGSVVLGYVPGWLLGSARRPGLLLALLLAPLLLPRYLLLYAWELVCSPTTPLGDWLSARPELARAAGTVTSTLTLVLWCWPLAAVVIAGGFRMLDRDIHRGALLDATGAQRAAHVTLPMLAPALLLALGLCFVVAGTEFGTFHLAGVETLGAALAVVQAETGSAAATARAAWPVVLPAAAVAWALWRVGQRWWSGSAAAAPAPPRRVGLCRAWLAVLLGATVLVPVGLLCASVRGAEAFGAFWTLHAEELGTSLLAASVGAAGALALAGGALALASLGRPGRLLACVVHPTILLAALLPGGLLAGGLVALLAGLRAAVGLREGWWAVSLGLTARLAGVVLILLRFVCGARGRVLDELAATDGAGRVRTWRSVHLPRLWPVVLAAGLLATMLGVVELPVTTVLLPAGVPCFSLSLLNQMHYARDQQVIASCLVLVGVYAAGGAVAAAGWLLLRRGRGGVAAGLLLAAAAMLAGGCGGEGRRAGPAPAGVFGRSGRGPGEFLYPRAIDIAADGTLWVVDKTGRFQHMDPSGRPLGGFVMPQVQAGKPTGFSIGPDGLLYVADTHYHRVMVYTPAGRLVRRFGSYGEGRGQMIYPTDVAFAPDGRLFVSEYGGNDRVTVWTAAGRYLGAFGRFGSGRGELSRPSAVKVDRRRRRLYVADACNHRLAVYDLSGRLLRYIGSVGRGAGQFRYPYDLALAADGRLVVCEYGNNRIQVLTPEGRCVGLFGAPGRQPGQLAYPWGVAVSPGGRAFVVDAGNNRIQVWQLD